MSRLTNISYKTVSYPSQYSLLLQYFRNGSKPKTLLMGKNTTSNSPDASSVKTVTGVSLETFSGLTCNFKRWYDSVINAYGVCGHQKFLYDETLCTKYDLISYSIKCNLLISRNNGTLVYIYEEMKTERNAPRFI